MQNNPLQRRIAERRRCDGNMNKIQTVLLGLLIPLGLFQALLIFMARPDSFEEMEAGMTNVWFFVGPIFGLAAYMLIPTKFKSNLLRKCISIAVGITVGALAAHISEKKIQSNVKARLGEDYEIFYQNYLESQQ